MMDVLRSKVLHGQRAGERIVVHTLPSLLLPSSNFIRTKKLNFVFRFVYYQQIDLPSFSFLSGPGAMVGAQFFFFIRPVQNEHQNGNANNSRLIFVRN